MALQSSQFYWLYSCGWISLIICCLSLVLSSHCSTYGGLEIKLWLKKSCGQAYHAKILASIYLLLWCPSPRLRCLVHRHHLKEPTQGDKSSFSIAAYNGAQRGGVTSLRSHSYKEGEWGLTSTFDGF